MTGKKREILSLKSKIIRWILSIFLLLYTSITIFILLSTLINSFKSKSDLINNVFGWPKKFLIDSYITVFTEDRFGLYFSNSLLLTFCGTFFCLFLSSMVAYGIARYDFKGKSLLASYFLFGMMFPIQISVLPLFIILKKLSLINTLLGMILIYAAGMSLPVYIFQKFFRTVPKSLDESARIDGAKEFTIYSKILLPLCKPVVFTVALIISVGEWNDFYMPMVFLGKKSCRTLTLAIYNYLNEFLKQMNVSFAAVIVTLIPIIVIYFLFSNQIVEGLTGGAVKE